MCSYILRRPQKLKKSSPSIRHYLVSVKSTVKISSIFVAFLEIMNFIVVKSQVKMSQNFVAFSENF